MKISELATKVDELISVANDVKNSTPPPATAVSPVQEDDPLVQQLADRIDEAVRVLRGVNSPVPSPAPVLDPNAPITDPGPNPFSPPPGQ